MAEIQCRTHSQTIDIGIAEGRITAHRPDSIGLSKSPSKDTMGEETETRKPCPLCGSHLFKSRIYYITQNNPKAATKANYKPPTVEMFYEECLSGHFKRQLLVGSKQALGNKRLEWKL